MSTVQQEVRWVETGINRTVPTSFTTAGHYFLILKGHHIERSKNWFQHLETKKGGVFFDVAYATKISVTVRPFTVQSIRVHQFCFFGEFQYFFFAPPPNLRWLFEVRRLFEVYRL